MTSCVSREWAGVLPGGVGRALGRVPGQPSLPSPGSLGARLHELKQKVVAENPQHFGVAVPRKRAHVCGVGVVPTRELFHGDSTAHTWIPLLWV